MSIKEVIRTSGDVRRTLAQTMTDIRTGDLSVDKGLAVAALAKEISTSLQVEVNVAKVRVAMLKEGHNLGELTAIGKLIIEDAGTVPTLSGVE